MGLDWLVMCRGEGESEGVRGGGGGGGGLTKSDVIAVVVGSNGSLSLLTVHIVEKPQLCPHLLCYHLPILYTQDERDINERDVTVCGYSLQALARCS